MASHSDKLKASLLSSLLSSNVLILESTRRLRSKSFRKGSEKSSVRGTFQTKKTLIYKNIEAFLFISATTLRDYSKINKYHAL